MGLIISNAVASPDSSISRIILWHHRRDEGFDIDIPGLRIEAHDAHVAGVGGAAASPEGSVTGKVDERRVRGRRAGWRDRIGIVGPNGAGKSTLVKILLGKLEPDSGKVTFGSKLEIAYSDQLREQLDPEKNLIDNVCGGKRVVL